MENPSYYKKWKIEHDNVRLLKYESRQFHDLCAKLITDGRLSIDEFSQHIDSRREAKKKLLKK